MKQAIRQLFFALFAALAALPLRAEDIDLFMGAQTVQTDRPNVLIILDNTANWNTAFENEKAALVSVFNGLPVDKFNVGLMMFTETGGGNSGNDGAYVRAAVRPMTAANKALYAAMINSLNQTGDKSNGGKIGKSMWEAYHYLAGLAPHAGNNKKKTDYTGNTDGAATDDAVYALAGNALSSKSDTSYDSPIDDDSCAKNYIIYISNGAAQDNSSDTTASKSALEALGGNSTQISINPSGSADNVADEWARFMKNTSSLGVTVYTVDINKVTTGQGPGWTALLKSMSNQSAGKYFDIASSGTQIVDTLNTIFSEIQSVNSVFASVSLPISVNTQGTFLNQVYVGMFRPDPQREPRWAGNLKQYKIGLTNGVLRLQDADSNAAINNQTGFITECARSFWTPTTVDTEWSSAPSGDCLTVANSQASNYPDGNIVDKGAQAYKLRGDSGRTVLTCNSSTCTSVVTFNNSNVTQARLGAASTTERDTLINFAIGKDVSDEDLDGVTTAERRLSIHGDVVHSRPVAVNFGADDASPSVVVFYGGNDGMLRAVNGNRTGNIGTIPPGGELWSFMPDEFLTKIKRLYRNANGETDDLVKVPAEDTGTSKDYGMDGPITAYKGLVGASQKTFLYGTMRRGGRSIYAFDVTNSTTTPSSPTFKWRIGCDAAGSCTSGMSGIGQTWSSVKTFTHAQHESGNKPLLIFGGGYDTCDDHDALSAGGANHNCTSSSKGHYVYVIDGDTGAVVRTFDTGGTRGVIADVIMDTDNAGHATVGYTADLGGNVYRIKFSGAPAAWTMDKIASLGCSDTESCTANRKFMFEPSVINEGGGVYRLLIGSGDREKPVDYYTASKSVTNYFFSFLDKPDVDPAEFPGTAYCDGETIICLESLLPITTSATPSDEDLNSKHGWYLALAPTEQVVTSAITIFGVTTFSTHQPAVADGDSCSANLGTTLVYNVGYEDASPATGGVRFADVSGDGLPPSAVGGQVTLDNGQTVPFCIGCSADSPLEAVQKSGGSAGARPKSRLYWYIEKK